MFEPQVNLLAREWRVRTSAELVAEVVWKTTDHVRSSVGPACQPVPLIPFADGQNVAVATSDEHPFCRSCFKRSNDAGEDESFIGFQLVSPLAVELTFVGVNEAVWAFDHNTLVWTLDHTIILCTKSSRKRTALSRLRLLCSRTENGR